MCYKEHKLRVRTENSLKFLRSHSSEFVFERNEIYVHDERDKCVWNYTYSTLEKRYRYATWCNNFDLKCCCTHKHIHPFSKNWKFVLLHLHSRFIYFNSNMSDFACIFLFVKFLILHSQNHAIQRLIYSQLPLSLRIPIKIYLNVFVVCFLALELRHTFQRHVMSALNLNWDNLAQFIYHFVFYLAV